MSARIAVADYQAIAAVNWSGLKELTVSPLMYKWRLTHPAPRKSAFEFGGAGHCAILEPDEFDKRYGIFDGVRNEKHEKWKTWKQENPGKEALTPAKAEEIKRIANAVLSHRVAGPLLRGGRCEESLTWTDETTGLACKGRLDYIRPDVILDLKTTRSPAPMAFERATCSYGYDGQVAFYHDGAVRLRLIDGKKLPYIIAAQSSEPYDVAVYQIKPETLDSGRALYRSLMRRLLECIEADYWPGVAPELQQLGLPPWASNRVLEQESEDF